MSDWLRNPIVLMAAVGLLVLAVMSVPVVLARRREKRLRSMQPAEVLEGLLQNGFAPGDVLMGVPQSNWLDAALLLRDAEGRSVGKIVYGGRCRIWIEAEGQRYLIREIKAPFLQTELVVDDRILGSAHRGRLATEPSRFETSAGSLTVEAGLKPFFKSDFQIVSGGQVVGRVLDAGKWSKGHAVLLLKGEFPLAVRAYILALEYRRMT